MTSYAEKADLGQHTKVTITGDLIKTNLLHDDPKKKYAERNLILANLQFTPFATADERKLAQIIKDHYCYGNYACLPYKVNKENAVLTIWGRDNAFTPVPYVDFVNEVGGELAPHQKVTVTFGVFAYNRQNLHPRLSQSLQSLQIASLLNPKLNQGYQMA